ncbi:FAD-binding-3 domain-containing protein [Mycena kentingensis (nom. inval.)]|nr:FAD-binding-3 domain-containing protein [Mycena kentingensis (nom. inval.)]
MTQEKRIRFIVAGASAAGLTAAIGLKAAGHDVLVLEKETQLGGPDAIPSGGIRLPPNGCKVLFDWGLEEEIRKHAVVGKGFTVWKYEGVDGGRDFLGTNRWPPELLTDARGDFLQMRHKDLLQILYDAALRAHTRKASESSLLHADAIIGADGARGYFRRALLAQESESIDADVPRGLAVYSAIIPKARALTDPLVAKLYETPQNQMVTFWQGPNRGAQALLTGAEEDLTLWVYTPDTEQDGSWTQPADVRITDVVGKCEPLIERLAQLSGPATCVQIKNSHNLESWVSKSGKVVVLGEAAHPYPTISLHTYSIAIEDGAFVGKIFSHTRNTGRVPEFLYAFEEARKPRCLHIYQSEKQYIDMMALPHGAMQAERDASMRANDAAGRNVMDSGDEHALQRMWDDMRMVFGYDPADAADEWWISWGRLRNSPDSSVSGVVTIHTDGAHLHG